MKTTGKQTCPTCGQSVNKREIALYSGMVQLLADVFRWCKEKGVHEFRRRDIAHLLTNDSKRARFSDWILFGGLVYRPEGQGKGGYYGMNMERVADFLAGRLAIPTLILKDPLAGTLEMTEKKTIFEIPHLKEFLDENQQFIASYTGVVEI